MSGDLIAIVAVGVALAGLILTGGKSDVLSSWSTATNLQGMLRMIRKLVLYSFLFLWGGSCLCAAQEILFN